MRYLAVTLVVLVANLVTVGCVYFFVNHKIGKTGIQILQTEQQISRFGSFGEEVETVLADRRMLKGRLDSIAKLEKGRHRAELLLVGLSETIPELVWLSDIRRVGPELTLNGYAQSNETLAQFINALQRKFKTDVTLKETSRQTAHEQKVYHFELAFTLEGAS